MKVTQFAFLDEDMNWRVEKGSMTVMAGASAGDIRLKDHFQITETEIIDGKNRGFYAEAKAE